MIETGRSPTTWTRSNSSGPHQFEYRMITADGRVVWMRDVVAVVIEKGRVKTLRGIMVDITERKCEEALRKRASGDQRHTAAARPHRFVAQTFGTARDLTTIFRAPARFRRRFRALQRHLRLALRCERNIRTRSTSGVRGRDRGVVAAVAADDRLAAQPRVATNRSS